jgi:outer membrane lipopolysaccharide assembly protein LptE/RlpB
MKRLVFHPLLFSLLLLPSCGFQLRGDPAVGIKTLHVSTRGPRACSPTSGACSPTAHAHHRDAADAEAQLRIISENRDKIVRTITGTGRVYEFQLSLTVRYEVLLPGREVPLIPPTEATAMRLITYSESAPTAKEVEEQLLFKDMQVDIAGRILRHIAVVRRDL